MDVRQSIHSEHARQLDTAALRREFLIEKIFEADRYTLTYSHIDRIIIGGVMPVADGVTFGNEMGKQLGVSYFLERRELGVINIGGPGTIEVDGKLWEIGTEEALYVGKGAQTLSFRSSDASRPAKFYFNSAPAHSRFPDKKVGKEDAVRTTLGDAATSNRRTINKYLVPDYMTSVQENGFYGWPYSYFGQHVDTRAQPQRPDLVEKAIKPDYALSSHVAPLGLFFYQADNMPQYRGGAFVSEHGSWNRTPLNGYQVVWVKFENGKPVGLPQPVVTGFLTDDQKQVRGLPVGLAADRQGGLLIADDAGNTVWRVSAK